MYPEQVVLRFDGASTTYAELEDQVAAVAGALEALGVQAGERIATLETNTPPLVAALYATASLRAVSAPLNYRAPADELAALLAVASPRLLLVGARYHAS